MKKYFKYGIVLTVLLASFLVFNQKANHPVDAKQTIEASFHSNSKTYLSLPQVSGAAYAEIATSVLSSLPTVNLNDKINKHHSFIDIANHLVQVQLKQYFTSAKNFLVASRKADLIFPFHYFW